jgi:hypothetical protein
MSARRYSHRNQRWPSPQGKGDSSLGVASGLANWLLHPPEYFKLAPLAPLLAETSVGFRPTDSHPFATCGHRPMPDDRGNFGDG